MEELLVYLNSQCIRARELLNSQYKNDAGQSLEDWAKGNLAAYVELRSLVERKIQEESYNRSEEATKGEEGYDNRLKKIEGQEIEREDDTNPLPKSDQGQNKKGAVI